MGVPLILVGGHTLGADAGVGGTAAGVGAGGSGWPSIIASEEGERALLSLGMGVPTLLFLAELEPSESLPESLWLRSLFLPFSSAVGRLVCGASCDAAGESGDC